jgi:hypothetical protein
MQFRARKVFLGIAIAMAIGLSFYKPAAAADDRETCKTASGDTAIAACARTIESKRDAKKKFKRTLSLLNTNRGVEYEIKKDFDHADVAAIKVARKNGAAYKTAAMPMPARATTITPSPTTTRPSSSIPNMPRPSTTEAWSNERRRRNGGRRRHRASQRASAGHRQ